MVCLLLNSLLYPTSPTVLLVEHLCPLKSTILSFDFFHHALFTPTSPHISFSRPALPTLPTSPPIPSNPTLKHLEKKLAPSITYHLSIFPCHLAPTALAFVPPRPPFKTTHQHPTPTSPHTTRHFPAPKSPSRLILPNLTSRQSKQLSTLRYVSETSHAKSLNVTTNQKLKHACRKNSF